MEKFNLPPNNPDSRNNSEKNNKKESWTIEKASQVLKGVYKTWKSTAKEGEFFTTSIIQKQAGALYTWCYRNKISPESLLPEEAKLDWKRTELWTIEKAKEKLDEVYQEWKKTAKEGEIFGPMIIRKKADHLDSWLRKNKISPESLLSEEAKLDWGRIREDWNEENAQKRIEEIHKTWKLNPKEGEKFGPGLIRKQASSLYGWFLRKKIPLESFLSDEAKLDWERKREHWDIEKAKEKLKEVYQNWEKTAKEGETFGPTSILDSEKGNLGLYRWLLENKISPESLLPEEAKLDWKRTELWTTEKSKEKLEEIYKTWKSTAKEGETFGPGLIQKQANTLYQWITKRSKVSFESLLSDEAILDWKSIELWTIEKAKEKLDEVYQEWKKTAKEGETFGPKNILKKAKNLYQWLRRNKIPRESLLPSEALKYWEKKEIVNWTEDLARQEISKIYTEWEKTAKEGEKFGPGTIVKTGKKVYDWLNKNKISIESLLPSEAISHWERMIIWTKDLVHKEILKIYSDWKVTAKEGDTFGPGLILKKQENLYKWLNKKNISIKSLLPTEALSSWENKNELNDSEIKEAPELWQTKSDIADNLGVSEEEIKRITDKLRKQNPEGFGRFKDRGDLEN